MSAFFQIFLRIRHHAIIDNNNKIIEYLDMISSPVANNMSMIITRHDVGTNNTDKEGTTAIVEKYKNLLKKTKQARAGQIILSGILPVFGNKIQGYRNSKRMAVNGMVKRLCKEEEVGYVDLWDSFVGKEEMYVRDGLHLSGKGAAVFAEGLSGAVASGLGKVQYLN